MEGRTPHDVTGLPDAVLLRRVREVVRGRATTEAELRKLRDRAGALARLLEVQIQGSERRIHESNRDPSAPLAVFASEIRRAADLRPQLEQLLSLIAQLDSKARELRAAWLLRG